MTKTFYGGLLLVAICGCTGTAPSQQTTVIHYAPMEVTRQATQKIFAHLMPWFEAPADTTAKGWGQHWTMANQDPAIRDSNGQRSIASYYYPLTGPYSSADTVLIDYQLLLMKLSGIQGVMIDWPGTTQLFDYPANLAHAEMIISRLAATGLHFAIVYEDQNLHIAQEQGVVKDMEAAAQQDMTYMEAHYFNHPCYEHYEGKPLLLVFGPQTFTQPAQWERIFSVLTTPPAFFTLWNHEDRAGHTATGAFAWINADNLVSLQQFYQQPGTVPFIAAAYPGFHPFYEKGGWPGPDFVIPSNGVSNFSQTLDLALQSRAPYIQLPTWNDYGEGTIIEPTNEFRYSLLTTLQQKLGVPYRQQELEQVMRLYRLRRQYQNDPAVLARLDQAFYYLVSLKINKAIQVLDEY